MPLELAVAHIHKTAGTSLSGILKMSYGGRYCLVSAGDPDAPFFSAADLARLRRWYPGIRAVMGHDVKPYGDLHIAEPRLSYVTFMRDPVVRAASHYQYDVQVGGVDLPLEEWITHPTTSNRQVRQLAGPDATAADAVEMVERRIALVGLLERFDESLLMLQRMLGLREVRSVAKWTAPANRIKRSVLEDPDRRGMLEEANREDIALHRYVTEEVFPRQVADYGPTLAADAEMLRDANRSMTKWRMYLNPRYAWYVVKWRLAYSPRIEASRDRVERGRAAARHR
jgi:hypothetical protein